MPALLAAIVFVAWDYKENVQNQQIEYSGRTSPTIKKSMMFQHC